MHNERRGYSIIDSRLFAYPAAYPGLDVARAPGLVWLRGEIDDSETQEEFLARAKRGAADAGFLKIEVSGFINTDIRRHVEDSER